MIAIDIKEIVSSIPDFLVYVIPGFIGISFFKSVTRIDTRESSTIVASCALSYVVLSLFRLFWTVKSVFIECVLLTVICLLICCVAIFIVRSKWVRKITVRLFSYSFSRGPWESAFDYKRGSRIRARFKNSKEVVVGVIHSMGRIEDNPWISLRYYMLFLNDTEEEPYFEQHNGIDVSAQ